jgi:hypothetical protein
MLNEGGNIFKDSEKQPLTQRINRADVDPTIKWLEAVIRLPLINNKLGTTGKKETSGDLDLAVDESKYDKETIYQELLSWVKNNYPQEKPRTWVAKSGISVHFKTPINGDANNGFVQTDLMFGDPAYMAWSSQGEPGDEYRGQHRMILINSIASANGFRWSGFGGLTNRETGEKTTDPRAITDILLGAAHSPKELSSIPLILNAIKDREDYDSLVAMAVETFPTFGVQFPSRRNPQETLSEGAEGPRIQHAEDTIFWEGSAGALRTLDLLSDMASDKGRTSTTIKWDGSPAVIFGRDEAGEFIFTDKSGFSAKGYDGLAKSPEQLRDMFIKIRRLDKGKDVPPSYEQFANNMSVAFKYFEEAIPQEHRGYFFGDLLYYTVPEIVENRFVFKPNIVTYKVDIKSELGRKIANSKAGVVIHREVDFDGNKVPIKSFDIFQGNSLLVVPPVMVQEPVKVNTPLIGKLKSFVKASSGAIDNLLDPVLLRSLKISNFAELLYAYLNSKVDTGLTDLGTDFVQWLEIKPGITQQKILTIRNYVAEKADGFSAVWKVVGGIISVKDEIIAQLEAQDAPVKASIGDTPGGEGYVTASPGGDIKLVDRAGFTKANRSVQREAVSRPLTVSWDLLGNSTTLPLTEWVKTLPAVSEDDLIVVRIGNIRKTVPAISKIVYESIRAGIPLTSFVPRMTEAKKAISGAAQYGLMTESLTNRIIAIYPGRFQPMGRHHYEVYKAITDKFGADNTYVVTSDKTAPGTSPLNFEQKKSVMVRHGIPEDHIIQARSPYQVLDNELKNQFDPDTTVATFIVGDKDMKENPRFANLGGMTKKGTPSYYRKWNSQEEHLPLSKHGYIDIAPHISISADEKREMSGTSLREILKVADPKTFKALMGWFDQDIFDMLHNNLEEMSGMGGGAVSGAMTPLKRNKSNQEDELLVKEVMDYLLGVMVG